MSLCKSQLTSETIRKCNQSKMRSLLSGAYFILASAVSPWAPSQVHAIYAGLNVSAHCSTLTINLRISVALSWLKQGRYLASGVVIFYSYWESYFSAISQETTGSYKIGCSVMHRLNCLHALCSNWPDCRTAVPPQVRDRDARRGHKTWGKGVQSTEGALLPPHRILWLQTLGVALG